jgi:DNA-binding beta-propeller fold protein YncE
MSLLKSAIAAMTLSLAIPAQAETTFSELWTLDQGLDRPESVAYDAKRERLYVSNVQGASLDMDGKGYISIIGMDGKTLDAAWVVDGLNAPKGMAVTEKTLYVSDIDALVAIDIDEGKVTQRYSAEGAKFLNDVTVDSKGNVYVSDMFMNTIHCLCDGKFSVWVQDAALGSPNGLFAEADRLIVGSWGIRTEGFKTTKKGYLKAIAYADNSKIVPLGATDSFANVDGVESDGAGGYYVTDWMAGKLFAVGADGKAQELMDYPQGSADLEYIPEKGLLIVPMMLNKQVKAFKKN